MRGDEASKKCPDLHIFSVPERNGKADLTRYREASGEVFEAIANYIRFLEEELMSSHLIVLERASVDEAFIDLTRYIDEKPLILPDFEDLDTFNTKLVHDGLSLKEWFDQIVESHSFDETHLRLIMGAILIGKLRKHIYGKEYIRYILCTILNKPFVDSTQFRCSAGISHNKMLAKLACSKNKPNAQTILPLDGVHSLFQNLDLSEVRSLGGKFGRRLKEMFAIETMGQLNQIPLYILEENLDRNTAQTLHELSKGYDEEPVTERRIPKSIGCGKNFPGIV